MKKIKPNQKMLEEWAKQGYTNQVREYTESIESNPAAVLEFCDIAGSWFVDYDWWADPRFKPAVDQIDESISALHKHLDDLYLKPIITIIRTQPIATVEVSWIANSVGLVLWDRFFVDCEDPVILLSINFISADVRYKLAPTKTQRTPSPLHRFHPERFRSTRDYAENFSRLYRQKAEFNTGAITEASLNKALAHLIKGLNEHIVSYPRRHKKDDDNQTIVLNREIIFGSAYGRFAQAGRQIMDFPPGLCEMLSHTDIGEIPVGEIKLPYVCQYLHFGPQQHLELEPGWFVDGAYIESQGGPGELNIVVTAKPSNQELFDLWYLNAEPLYSQSFKSEHREVYLGAALETVLRERLNEQFENKARAESGFLEEEAKKLISEQGQESIVASVVDIGARTARIEIDETNRRHPVFIEALKLIINGLLYITAYPEDIETTWPDKAPLALRDKALHGNSREMDKAKSKLTELGYSPVHLCGKSFTLHHSDAPHLPSDGHKSLHWRRGHWRNQPYGAGRTQHRLRWIMPMLVGAKNNPNDDPELGHIYLIS